MRSCTFCAEILFPHPTFFARRTADDLVRLSFRDTTCPLWRISPPPHQYSAPVKGDEIRTHMLRAPYPPKSWKERGWTSLAILRLSVNQLLHFWLRSCWSNGDSQTEVVPWEFFITCPRKVLNFSEFVAFPDDGLMIILSNGFTSSRRPKIRTKQDDTLHARLYSWSDCRWVNILICQHYDLLLPRDSRCHGAS